MECDPDAAARFLAALTCDSQFSFQTFPDVPTGSKGLNRILHGRFESKREQLRALSGRGAGVFVMVNAGDGRGRKAANVTAGRALFVDLDGAPLEPVLAGPLAPRIVVESSPGKWHCYWPIADMPLGCFTDAQKALAARFGGDPKVHDNPRVMRLPGFPHRKGAPFISRLDHCERSPYTWQEVSEAFRLQGPMALPRQIATGERNATLFKLALSASRKGVPQGEQLAKAEKVNATRCHPPLAASEVAQVVASAYSRPTQGCAAIPLAVIDSDAYKALGDGARGLLLLAYRRANNFNPLFPLLWSELRPWFPREKTFKRLRKELAESSLLEQVIAPVAAQPRNGRGPKPTYYRIPIGDKSAPYSTAPIGDKSAPPEALQAPAVEPLIASASRRPRRRTQSGSARTAA